MNKTLAVNSTVTYVKADYADSTKIVVVIGFKVYRIQRVIIIKTDCH